jgi:putative ABC transport system substrate-binding protein
MGSDMKRRNFIMAIGGAVLWPLKVWAQANSQTKRVGVLIARAEIDPEGKQHFDALVNELERLGWSRGRNLEMETRWWSSDAIKRLAFVRELVALKPDVMLVNSSSYLTAARPEVGKTPVVFVAVTDPVVQGFSPMKIALLQLFR